MEPFSRSLAADALLQLSSSPKLLISADDHPTTYTFPLDLSKRPEEDESEPESAILMRSQKQPEKSVSSLIETIEKREPGGVIYTIYKCKFCGDEFRHKRSCGRHVNCKHALFTCYSCKQCPKVFGRMDHLKIHMRVHSNSKGFPCNYCNFGYKTQAALQAHIHRIHHKLAQNKEGKCKQLVDQELEEAVTSDQHKTVVPPLTQSSPSYHIDRMLHEGRDFYFQAKLDLYRISISPQF